MDEHQMQATIQVIDKIVDLEIVLNKIIDLPLPCSFLLNTLYRIVHVFQFNKSVHIAKVFDCY